TGGKRIPSVMFRPVFDGSILKRLSSKAQRKVMAVNLTKAGITDLGIMKPFGAYKLRQAPLEVFYNGEPLRLAQWPNKEFVNMMRIPDGTTGRRFTYKGNRPLRWKEENDIWGYGYWFHGWSDEAIKIVDINTATKTITLKGTPKYGLKRDADRKACFSRAPYYWRLCGADPYNPVTAIYRPDASESTYP
ncbi:hypothetical protein FSP39_014112, partial [Pinctada imbricata]